MNYKNTRRILNWLIFLAIILIGLSLAKHNTFVRAEDNSTNSTNTTIPSQLIISDIDNYVNQSAYFFAAYNYENGTIAGATCAIKTALFENPMLFNSSNYYYNHIYSTAGNYSYTINCYKEGYENLTESSTIEILPLFNQITDNDNDGYSNETDCNDNNPNINPGKQEVLYNGLDDDCNPLTPDFLTFDMTTEKQTYYPGEIVKIRINARNSSDTYITINTPTNISYIYIFANGNYPATQEFSLTGLSGVYSIDGINYFGNYTNVRTAEFNVQNTMNVEIQTDKDTAYENENIHFKAVITGAIGNANMIWKMDNSQEKYVSEFDYSYSAAREYNIVLIVTDQGGNQITKTRKITIKKQYYLKVKVFDNSTGGIITNATVKLDSNSKKVNSTGEVEFKTTNRTYELRASAENYYTYSEDIKLNNSLIFTIYLVKDLEDIPPLITIISPQNNTIMSTPEFKFKFNDNGEASCSLYITEGEGWWQEAISLSQLQPNTEYSFKPELENNTYTWRIQCLDEDGNLDYSPQYIIKISEEEQQQIIEQPDTTYSVIQNVYDVIPDFETYSPDEKKIVEYLNMENLIKDSKRKLEMANRDLFNLKYQPDTDSILKVREEIYARIEQIKDETPLSIRAEDKVDFVKYVEDSDVEASFSEYISLKNIVLSNSEKKKLIEQNKLLQKKAAIQTTAYNIDINYISGRTEQVTMIVRNIEIDTPSEDLSYVEFIPKEITQSSNNIVFITPADRILKEDPVFEIQLSKAIETIYYIKEYVALDNIPKIKPFIFTTKTNSNSNSITGFAIFDGIGLSESNKTIFIIEMLVVFILLGVYLFYYFSSSQSGIALPNIFRKEPEMSKNTEQRIIAKQQAVDDPHKVGYIKIVLQKAKDSLKNNNLNDAAVKYYEIKFLYNLLDEQSQNMLFNEVITLADDLNYKHIQQLVDKAIIDLAVGNYDQSLSLYEAIQEEFNKLSEDYQEKIYSRCCELALHLKEIKPEENENI